MSPHMLKAFAALIVPLFFLTLCKLAEAAPPPPIHFEQGAVSFSTDWHIMRGKTYEIVYEGPDKISELIWEIPTSPMLETKLSYKIKDFSSLSISSYFRLHSPKGSMTDSDWDPELNINNTLISFSDSQTVMSRASAFDIRHSIPVFTASFDSAAHDKQLTINFLQGYRERSWAWRAQNGYQIFNPDGLGNGLDWFVAFDEGQTGISFWNRQEIPYLGFSVDWADSKLDWEFTALYSSIVRSIDRDKHQYRNLIFNETIEPATFIELGVRSRYHINDTFSLLLGYRHERLFEARGDSLIHYWPTNLSYFAEDSVALSHYSHNMTLGFYYAF